MVRKTGLGRLAGPWGHLDQAKFGPLPVGQHFSKCGPQALPRSPKGQKHYHSNANTLRICFLKTLLTYAMLSKTAGILAGIKLYRQSFYASPQGTCNYFKKLALLKNIFDETVKLWFSLSLDPWLPDFSMFCMMKWEICIKQFCSIPKSWRSPEKALGHLSELQVKLSLFHRTPFSFETIIVKKYIYMVIQISIFGRHYPENECSQPVTSR